MFPPSDAPLTSGQRFILLILTLFFPVLLVMYIVAFFWFRDTYPQRARSIAGVGLTFMQGVLLVVVVAVAFQFLAALFVRS
ncbi:hypothetical protein DEIPH_ctg025orf0090 [Deinococcus phoenicis]|uniref:Uncharacterized protein n=1 Tax=Deinococcus phoenicis TaxID=1476583 RepID=A0A016QQ89_9DEIO|nr:hypothetical protein [Deinococcus phoenicis]EYB68243.1 hypothetical protein DEIPH_ctg025orf0090 [Deinococcus phoenicis]